MERKNRILKLLYLYLFSLVGLVLIIIGSVQIMNLALTAWVFTEADQVRLYPTSRPAPPDINGSATIDPAEEERLKQERLEHMEKERDSKRQRTAANAMAMMIVGAPLYLYHWRSIKNIKS